VIGDILSPTHLLFILVVALVVLGPKRLPEAGRALGKGIRDFRMAIGGEDQNHGTIPTGTMSAPSPPMTAVPVSPAPEPAEAQPPAFDSAPPAFESAPPAFESAPPAFDAPPPATEPTDATESAEPARPFV